ncbi:hypothetical protein [Methanobrevibacter sp.]|uniref:hypothetical protein n=1 Tax=Methanobrevibacter sp. TaxID=66852 RepID=UPI0038696792
MNLNSKFNYRDFIIFIVPVLIFSLYLYIYNPGILTAASFSQLHQIATGEFTGAYPILHTIIEMICLKIYASPASIGAFQILVFSVIWMLICNYHRDDAKSDSNGFVLQFIITMIVCLIPINAIYSITLSSNILFSYAVLFLCFLIKVIIDRNGQISSKLAIMIAVTLAFISGLNTFGIYVSVLSLVIIMAYLFIKKTPQDALIKLGLISVVCIVLITSLGMIYQTDANNNFPANDAFEDGVNLENAKSQFFKGINDVPKEGFENATQVNVKTDKFKSLNSIVDMTRENIILDGLLNSPIVYVILSIILLGFIYYTTNSHEIFLIFIPNLLNMVICLVSGQNNLYSNLLVCYLIIIILANMWPNLKSQGTETPAPARNEQSARIMSQPKEYVPPKAEMNQPQEEYQTVDYQLEELTLDEGTNQRIEYEDGGSDLVDEILNEIKNEKK